MARRKTDDVADAYPPWTLSTKPAPGDLRIVQALVSTVDPVSGTDALADERQLADWLARWRLAAASIELTPDDLEQVAAVRQALHSLIRAGVATAAADALETLDRAASRAPFRLRFEAGGVTRLEPFSEGLGGAFARLFQIVATALENDRFTRFKICANPDCRKVFYDFAPNRVGTWCSKSPCANRMHGRTFRRRHPHYY